MHMTTDAHTTSLVQSLQSLRKFHLHLGKAYIVPTDSGASKIGDWRTFPQASTPWHQLTRLSVSGTSSMLQLIAIILTSETVTHLHITESSLSNDHLSHSAIQDLRSAMEVHCHSLTSFLFNCSTDETTETPKFDQLLPFLPSLTHLDLDAVNLDSTNSLLSLPKLKSFTISELSLRGRTDNGLTITDLLAFIRQKEGHGVLEFFKVLYYRDMFYETINKAEVVKMDQLKEEAKDLSFEVVAKPSNHSSMWEFE